MHFNRMKHHQLVSLKICIVILASILIMKTILNQRVLGMAINYHSSDWSPAEVTLLQRRSAESQNFHVQVKTFGEIHESQLIRAPRVFSPNFEEYVAVTDNDGNHQIHKHVTNPSEQLSIESQIYTNVDGSASLLVRDHNDHVTLEGILNDDFYITEDVRQVRSSDSTIRHKAFKRHFETQIKCSVDTARISVPYANNRRSVDDFLTISATVQPEIFLVIEYQMSKYFNHDLNAIKRYVGVFFNSVNRRYSTMKSIKIQHVICGLLQVTSETTEDAFKIKNGINELNDNETLFYFGKWMFHQKISRNITANFDIAIWMTSQEFQSKGSRNSTILGVAYIGGACEEKIEEKRFLKVGLVKDNLGKYSGIVTMAHELGHLLGASHDGFTSKDPPGNPGAENCSSSDGYIMAKIFNPKEIFNFSPCSEKQFNFFINSKFSSCLWNTPTSTEVILNQTLPGTLISLSNQCKTIYGDNYFYRENDHIVDMCRTLACTTFNEKLEFHVKLSYNPALEGSPCNFARTKWCINGMCVSKSKSLSTI